MAVGKRVGVVGAGNIGESIISGLIEGGITPPRYINASDILPERLHYLSKTYHVNCFSRNSELVERSDVIFLAVKPRDVKGTFEEMRSALEPRHVLVSMVAGVSIGFIAEALNLPLPIIRIMPNIAVRVREGMIAVAPASNVGGETLKGVLEMVGGLGRTVVVEEKHLAAVTGLSGSGPAYVSLILEALAEAGVEVGLPRETAALLAAQTVMGSAKMLLETGLEPSKLVGMVATPGGTTVEGLRELEEGRLRDVLVRAVVRATKRARELSTP